MAVKSQCWTDAERCVCQEENVGRVLEDGFEVQEERKNGGEVDVQQEFRLGLGSSE